jgi:hypothetical protein
MISPHLALLDAQIKEIGEQLRQQKWQWFQNRNINVLDKDLFWLLNKVDNYPTNQWNLLCNGLLYTKGGKLVSFPLMNFYNFSSSNVIIDLRSCDLIEEIGGQTVCVFWPFKSYNVYGYHSTDKVSTYEPDRNFFSNSIKLLNKVNFGIFQHETEYTLTFKHYKDELFFIAGRKLNNLFEYSEPELDIMATKMRISRPLRFHCTKGWETASQCLKTREERFIVRERTTGERATISLPLSCSRPKLLESCKYKQLLPYWQTDRNEIIRRYPATKEKFESIDKAFGLMVKDIKFSLVKWRTLNIPKKNLYEAVHASDEPKWKHSIILALHDEDEKKWESMIHNRLLCINTKTLMELLNLKDQ